jgi:hypothetical protein
MSKSVFQCSAFTFESFLRGGLVGVEKVVGFLSFSPGVLVIMLKMGELHLNIIIEAAAQQSQRKNLFTNPGIQIAYPEDPDR